MVLRDHLLCKEINGINGQLEKANNCEYIAPTEWNKTVAFYV